MPRTQQQKLDRVVQHLLVLLKGLVNVIILLNRAIVDVALGAAHREGPITAKKLSARK